MENVKRDTHEKLAKQIRKLFFKHFSCSSEINIFSNWIHFYIHQIKKKKSLMIQLENNNSYLTGKYLQELVSK